MEMFSLNKIILIGQVDRISIGSFGNNKCITFNVITTKKWRANSGEDKTKRTIIRCSVWGPQADWLEQNLEEDQWAHVEGEIQYFEKDGVGQYEVNAAYVKILK